MSPEAARRCALAASGLAGPRPRTADARSLRRVFDTLRLSQVDSVSRVVRSHYLPFFSRLGAYPQPTLDRLLGQAPRMGVEYWAHAAAYAHPSTVAMFDGRRADWYRHDYGQADPEHGAAFARLMRELLAALAEGPGTARELAGRVERGLPERRRDHWGWNPTRTKEALFAAGSASVARRNQHFEKVFALPADVHPDLPAPELRFGPPDDPQAGMRAGARLPRGIGGRSNDAQGLIRQAAAALGVASLDCLADYFRLTVAEARRAAHELTAAGELIPVEVAGREAFRWHAARVPRAVDACALLAPFDPLVFNRRRIAWLFGFDYRISIYTPAHLREHGYYVMPFLCGERLVARVDAVADRAAGTLSARAHWEPCARAGEAGPAGPAGRAPTGPSASGAVPARLRARLSADLEELARWLGLGRVQSTLS